MTLPYARIVEDRDRRELGASRHNSDSDVVHFAQCYRAPVAGHVEVLVRNRSRLGIEHN